MKKSIIVNKSKSDSSVGHWLLIIRTEPDIVELFDSLGCNGEDLEILKRYGVKIKFNETRVQGPDSKNCGIFCLYVAFWRLANIDQTFSEALADLFSKNFSNNDKLVLDFLSENST